MAMVLCASAGCSPLSQGLAEYRAGRARLVLPPGEWIELGQSDEALPVFSAPGIPLQTRAVGLRGPHNEWLAVLLVQTNASNYPRDPTLWAGRCVQQKDVWVNDLAHASPVRVDCVRLKRSASSADWLARNHPELMSWVASHKTVPAQPYSHLNYRYATEGGAFVEVNALVDQRLLRPTTSSNQEFLRAGQPAQAWALEMAQAARLSVALVDGYLPVPPFPIALPH